MEGLKAARLSKGLTQLELAQKVGVVRETVSLWESGTNRVNSEMLVRLSEVLECSVDFLCKNTLWNRTLNKSTSQQEAKEVRG